MKSLRRFLYCFIFLYYIVLTPPLAVANSNTQYANSIVSNNFCWVNSPNVLGPSDGLTTDCITLSEQLQDITVNFPAFNIPLNAQVDRIIFHINLKGNTGKRAYLYKDSVYGCVGDNGQEGDNPSYSPSSSTNLSIQDVVITRIGNCAVLEPSYVNSILTFKTTQTYSAPPGTTQIDSISLQVDYTPAVMPTSTPTPTPTPTSIPTPSASPTPAPFLDLPWDYKTQGKTFEQVAFNPGSWFDHKYPLQDVTTFIEKVLRYDGQEATDSYRSHSGYDYNATVGVGMFTPVTAAASGSAEFEPASESGGGGIVIKIAHPNGYQTWYEHLDPTGLIVDRKYRKIDVEKGQVIGRVGMTGRTTGPHIHLSVFKDVNGNGNFNDDYPYGLLDPLGWEPQIEEGKRDKDPWAEYGSSSLHGATSYQLYTAQAKPKTELISTSIGGSIKTDDNNTEISVPPGASLQNFTMDYTYGSFEKEGNVSSVAPSFFLNAKNTVGDAILQFLKPIKIIYKYQNTDLSNINEDSLKIYYYNFETLHWDPLPSSEVDKANKIISANTMHFSHFALMGEIKDIIAPSTNISLFGEKGQDNWYKSGVRAELNSRDNDGGIGLQYTLYTLNGDDWFEYGNPVLLDKDGDYVLTYQSFDKASNIEERKNIAFGIDRVQPITMIKVNGTKGQNGWYTSDVSVELIGKDDRSGVSRTEYSLNGGSSYSKYTDPILISSEGSSDIFYRTTDKAGNWEEVKSYVIKLDKTAPNTRVYTTGSSGQENWYRTNVQLAFNVKDEASGFNKTFYSFDGNTYQEYTDPLSFKDEGKYKVFYYSTDTAGNKEEPRSSQINIDKTPPVVSIFANPSSIWPPNGKMVNVKVTGSSSDAQLFDTAFSVTDEYNAIKPSLTNFGQTIQLQASRNGVDKDGRIYVIQAEASDLAGNKSTAETKIIVPHDQR